MTNDGMEMPAPANNGPASVKTESSPFAQENSRGGNANNRQHGGPGQRGGNRQGGRGRGGQGGGDRGPPTRSESESVRSFQSGRGSRRGGNPGGPQGFRAERNLDERFYERMQSISGPTIELPPIDTKEREFNSRCRLYIGNLTPDTTEEDLTNLMAPYGKTGETFLNREKLFAFVRLDYRANAEKARRELDGVVHKGKSLRIRYSPSSSIIKVKNLTQFVTNELLEWGFQVFGEIERAVVIADDRGKSTGEGIVEYSRKHSALNAIKRCTEGCYFLTKSLKPVIVEPYEETDDVDGFSEKTIVKRNEFYKEREVGPRFARAGTFEAEYGEKWKALAASLKVKQEALDKEAKALGEQLEAQMEFARYEHETELLRQTLLEREKNFDRQKLELEARNRAADEHMRRSNEDFLARQERDRRPFLRQDDADTLMRDTTLMAAAHGLEQLLQGPSANDPFTPDMRRGGRDIRSEAFGAGVGIGPAQGENNRGNRDRDTRWGDRRPMPLMSADFPINKRRRF